MDTPLQPPEPRVIQMQPPDLIVVIHLQELQGGVLHVDGFEEREEVVGEGGDREVVELEVLQGGRGGVLEPGERALLETELDDGGEVY